MLSFKCIVSGDKKLKMSLTKENFQYLDLPDLLLNIWDYGVSRPNNDLARKQWKDEYFGFNDTIEKIYANKKESFRPKRNI